VQPITTHANVAITLAPVSGFTTIGDLTRVSLQSHLSYYKGDKEVKPGAVHRSPKSYLTSEENPRILS
jgi:hypothetical protein